MHDNIPCKVNMSFHRNFLKGKMKTEQCLATSRSNCVSCNYIRRSAILNWLPGWRASKQKWSLVLPFRCPILSSYVYLWGFLKTMSSETPPKCRRKSLLTYWNILKLNRTQTPHIVVSYRLAQFNQSNSIQSHWPTHASNDSVPKGFSNPFQFADEVRKLP